MNLETVVLQAADLNGLLEFYGDRLGLPTLLDKAKAELSITIGTSRLIFQHRADFRGRYHFAFNLPENRLAAGRAFLAARGITLIPDATGETLFDFDFWDAHTIYFFDSAGNIAEFIARHELDNDLQNADTFSFSPKEIQNISEIALPAPDVPVLGKMLSETVGVAEYRDTNANFMPLGDANGLFILVTEGRVWFPDTDIPAEALPLQAVIVNDSGLRFRVSGLPYRVETDT